MLYCIDLKTNEIHVLGCRYIPSKHQDKSFLGRFNNPNDAIAEAKFKGFLDVNACFYCCFSTYMK